MKHYLWLTGRSLLRIGAMLLVPLLAIWLIVAQPQWGKQEPSRFQVDPKVLEHHVRTLSVDFHPRNYGQKANLQRTADYISRHLTAAGAQVSVQTVHSWAGDYQNIIGTFGAGRGSRYIIGAHYDSCDSTPGADDNASGVAGMLELARLIGRYGTEREIRLVAWVLEEPPFFSGPDMGSNQHAESLREQKLEVDAAISIEMIGYYSDEWGSQSYAVPWLMELLYSPRGNFVALVGRNEDRDLLARLKRGMQGRTPLPVYSLAAPINVAGIDLSDHASYWRQGYPAVMLTDTAFMRNTEYHANDTWDRLDYRRMSQVVVALYEAVRVK